MVRESNNLWQKHAIQIKFYRKSDPPQDIYLALQPAQDLSEPDLLLYWVSAPKGNVLPADAQLVGTFITDKTFRLPLSENHTSYLVLFRTAHQSVFGTLPAPGFLPPPGYGFESAQELAATGFRPMPLGECPFTSST